MVNHPPSPELSIVIPCYNEAGRIGSTAERVLAYLDEGDRRAELILIDDGSTDGTSSELERLAASDARVRLGRLWPNRGKGAAVRRGVELSGGRHVVFFDADLSFPLAGVDDLVAALEAGADLAIGLRGESLEGYVGQPSLRKLASRVYHLTVKALVGLDIPDTQCGFKGFRGDAARRLFAHLTVERFGFDVEMLTVARRWGLRIVSVPVHVIHREGSTVRLLRDGVRMLQDLLQVRWNLIRGRYRDDE